MDEFVEQLPKSTFVTVLVTHPTVSSPVQYRVIVKALCLSNCGLRPLVIRRGRKAEKETLFGSKGVRKGHRIFLTSFKILSNRKVCESENIHFVIVNNEIVTHIQNLLFGNWDKFLARLNGYRCKKLVN
jgi:hypothetical protein